MTTNAGPQTAGPYTGNGTTALVMPFTFRIFEAADILLTGTTTANVSSTMVLGVDYTVSVNANQVTTPGGTVTMLWVAPLTESFTITTAIPYNQNLVLTSAGGLAITNALDWLSMQIKQLAVGVAISLSIISTVTNNVASSVAAAAAAAASAAAAAASAAMAAAAAAAAGLEAILPVTLASASTVAIGAAVSRSIIMTGTTTVNAFDTFAPGTIRYVMYSGAVPITYNAVSMQLMGGVSRTNAAGDVSIFESLGGGNWKELVYQQLSGITNFIKKYIPAGSAFTTVVLTPAQSGSFIKLTNTYATLPALAQGLTYTFIGPGTINAGYAVPVYFPDNTSTSGMPSISVGYGCSLEIGCDGTSWFVYNMAGDVMLTQASGLTHRAVRSDQILAGAGTSYQNMTGLGGRALATNIYNGNAYPIEVTVTSTGGAAIDTYNTISLTVGSETFNGTTSTSRGVVQFATVSAVVPAGVWYSVNSNYSLSRWSELR